MNLVLDIDHLRSYGREPRLHGNGFIQLDLGSSDQRLNIWPYPDIQTQAVSTPIHNHGYSFESKVLLGRVVNRQVDIVTVPAQDATHVIHVAAPRGICPKCKSQGKLVELNSTFECCGERFRSEDTVLAPVTERPFCFAKTRAIHVVDPGDFYTVAALDYHESMAPREWVMTLMTKTMATAARPCVLVPKGASPDNDFNRHLSQPVNVLWEAVDEACKRVRSAAWSRA